MNVLGSHGRFGASWFPAVVPTTRTGMDSSAATLHCEACWASDWRDKGEPVGGGWERRSLDLGGRRDDTDSRGSIPEVRTESKLLQRLVRNKLAEARNLAAVEEVKRTAAVLNNDVASIVTAIASRSRKRV